MEPLGESDARHSSEILAPSAASIEAAPTGQRVKAAQSPLSVKAELPAAATPEDMTVTMTTATAAQPARIFHLFISAPRSDRMTQSVCCPEWHGRARAAAVP